MNASDPTLSGFLSALSARAPTPGGGAAAAIAAALGCASGAMAARYTTGAKWAAVSARAEALAQDLDRAATACRELAAADARAYAAVTAARAAKDAAALALAETQACQVPADLLAACADAATSLAAFAPVCNPNLLSDVKVGIALLSGAGRAAWHTLLVNRPDAARQAAGRAHLAALDAAVRTIDG